MTYNVSAGKYEALEKENERLRERERELCAQVERLREAIEEHRMRCDEECVCTEDEMLWAALDETPAQSLREIRAEAGREGYREAQERLWDWSWMATTSMATQTNTPNR